ncbi:unnamed protein product [Polarella glacialis]|uniref:H(+)-exporting diphosphatase n=1 Tax=Polarella glacialis TaxID=89957 RepID=A0A813K321_POLGL|nr:unnamed protein product [Polarella glacialis]
MPRVLSGSSRSGRRSRLCLAVVTMLSLSLAMDQRGFSLFTLPKASKPSTRTSLIDEPPDVITTTIYDPHEFVQATEQNVVTAASTLAGVVGLLLGGFGVGLLCFAVASYVARKEEDDVAFGLRGVASASLEALNFASYLDDKYEVSSNLMLALVGSWLMLVGNYQWRMQPLVSDWRLLLGIKALLGDLLTAGSDAAATAVSKAVELNEEYQVSTEIQKRIDAAVHRRHEAFDHFQGEDNNMKAFDHFQEQDTKSFDNFQDEHDHYDGHHRGHEVQLSDDNNNDNNTNNNDNSNLRWANLPVWCARVVRFVRSRFNVFAFIVFAVCVLARLRFA